MEANSEVIRSIPKEVWSASIDLISKLVYPVTATTVGIGKLIEQKFSTLNEVQKIIAEQTLKEATKKVRQNSKKDFSKVIVKPQVIYTVLENVDSQSDDSIRSLWVNLTARELSEGSVHPEIARLFGKLTAADLMILSEHYAEHSSMAKLILKSLASAYTLGILRDPKSFNHVYLKDLGLLEDVSGKWFCTTTGKELMNSISELE